LPEGRKGAGSVGETHHAPSGFLLSEATIGEPFRKASSGKKRVQTGRQPVFEPAATEAIGLAFGQWVECFVVKPDMASRRINVVRRRWPPSDNFTTFVAQPAENGGALDHSPDFRPRTVEGRGCGAPPGQSLP
jgi:hypothetical protein